MARPTKDGMDYFPHDTDAANDEKIEALRALHGNDGYAFYFIVLERIYRSAGAEFDVSKPAVLAALIAKVGVNKDQFYSMLETAFDIECLDRKAYQDSKVLTSNGVKKRANEVNSMRDKWRRNKSKKVENKTDNSGENLAENPEENRVENQGENAEETRERKVKESKVKESKENRIDDNAREDDAEEVLNLYQNEVGIVSPTVAELLLDAIKVNSSEWVKAAIHEAVKHNARNWSYVDAILKSWRNNGFKTKPKSGSSPSRASPPMSDEEKAKKFAKPDCERCQGTGYETFFVEGVPLPKVKCECWYTPTKT